MKLLLYIFIFLLLISPAQARLSPNTQTAKEVAINFWEGEERCPIVHIRRDFMADYDGDRDDTYAYAWIETGREGNIIRCGIHINRRFYFSPLAMCHVIMHEYGHLADWKAEEGEQFIQDGVSDYTHSRNPNSVMYPKAREEQVKRQCKEVFTGKYKIKVVL